MKNVDTFLDKRCKNVLNRHSHTYQIKFYGYLERILCDIQLCVEDSLGFIKATPPKPLHGCISHVP